MTEILIIFFLILLNGLFSMSEIALVSARRSSLQSDANRGDRRAQLALRLMDNPNRLLSTVQVGITLVGLLTGIFSGERITQDVAAWVRQFPQLAPYSGSIGLALVLVAITFFSLVLGELVPKRIGMSHPERIAKTMAMPMQLLSQGMKPFIWLLSSSSELLVRLMGLQRTSGSQVTEEEIKSLVLESATGGQIAEIEQELVHNVFHLGDRNVASLMTQRPDVVWLDVEDPHAENIGKLLENPFDVLPVCEGDLDNVLGVLHIKDLLGRDLHTDALPNIKALLRPASYIPENCTAYQALERFQSDKGQQALVVDEYGTVQGIVTLDDILHALVAEVSEEEFEIVRREDGGILLDAQMPLDDFIRYFELDPDLREDLSHFNTMGGLVLHILQDLPHTGERFDWQGFSFEIVDMDKNRIDKLLVYDKRRQVASRS